MSPRANASVLEQRSWIALARAPSLPAPPGELRQDSTRQRQVEAGTGLHRWNPLVHLISVQRNCLVNRHYLIAFLSAVSLLCASSALAQEKSTKGEFEPYVGQPGKDVVWVPTPESVVNGMLDLAKLTANDFLVDLGSGDGRTVITAGKRGTRAMGVEFNPEMVAISNR